MKWFNDLSTMTKLMSAFAALSVMLFAIGFMGIQATGRQNDALDTVYETHMKGTTAILTAEMERLDIERNAREALLSQDAGERRRLATEADAGFQRLLAQLDTAEKTIGTAEGREAIKTIRDNYTDWEQCNRQTLALAAQGRVGEAQAVLVQGAEHSGRMNEAIDAIVGMKVELGEKAVKAADDQFSATRNSLLTIVALGTLFALGLGFFISKTLAAPLREAARVLGLVADGDFTQTLHVDSKDEIGQLAKSLNVAVDAMRDALTQVSHSASTVTTASSELSSASQAISGGAQEQASALEETAASLEEMTSAVKQNADNAQQAAQLAQGARDVAEKGGKVVGSAVVAMQEINASSKKIADIITAIDEIAFQTNLLALNAAVEAARAGEQGRGFAVVAGEVRNLAQRSASAAKEIKGLIHDSVQKVESGSKLVNQSGHQLEEIVTSVKRVTDIVAEIAASSREQATGIEQVNTAVTQMDAVTQSNASQTEELAGTAEGLSTQAQQMMSLVQRFKLGGAHAEPVAASAAAPRRGKVLSMPHRGSAKSAGHAAAAQPTGTDGGFEEF